MILLETPRLQLRNFQLADIEDFYAYMSLESTARYEDFDPMSYEQCEESIQRRITKDHILAVVLKEHNVVIGDVNFTLQEDGETYEIGYDFHEQYGKQGYATEACQALLNHIFITLAGRRVFAQCNDDNENSIRLLERLGFRREGYFMEDVSFKMNVDGTPIYINSYLYAMLCKEYLNHK